MKVIGRNAQHADVRVFKKLFDTRLNVRQSRPLQVCFEIENNARRRDEKIPADQDPLQYTARRSCEFDVGRDLPPAPV